MEPSHVLGALAALVAAVAALVRVLSSAFETRFADLRKELARLRDELEVERRLRAAAQSQASAAERRAEIAEAEVQALILVNERMRAELELMRSALVGSEIERNEALKELARRSDEAARKRAASAEDTAPHRALK
jgi:chromosome segregation ATPase